MLRWQPEGVVRLLVTQAGKLVAIGAVIRIIAAIAMCRILSGFLYGISATDGITFFAVTIVLVSVALVACYIPARRAARVDPMIALRHE
jgi:putative ABC transport system permease protein